MNEAKKGIYILVNSSPNRSIIPNPFFGFQKPAAIAADIFKATAFVRLLRSQRRDCSSMPSGRLIGHPLVNEA